MILRLLEKLGRKRIVYDRLTSEPYLERYYLLLRHRSWFPFNVFIHKFLSSDPSDLHDHPWNYATFILKGGYWEHTPKGKFWRGPGHFRYAKAESKHRIELDPKITAWTLFIPMKQRREWGFWAGRQWINNKDYKLQDGGIMQNEKIQSHLEALLKKHRELDEQIKEGYTAYLDDVHLVKMKQEKLLIKDQIERLKQKVA